ncbi:hypothetical protein QQS21_000158 [Conoideocrella luteorostrata]|uniref:Uncharacterized protein n=1 Tax=Conoideocrella luteorostrata TaxID=1105319 RepID=A0AAJ0D166_9HYPO|nr:hypothetical protein QQS21_000158 [Conoideocrella luteorostrata]
MFDSLGDRSEDREFWERYLKLLPKWLDNGYLNPNPQKELGRLEDIPKGFELQKKGDVSARKLMYRIA